MPSETNHFLINSFGTGIQENAYLCANSWAPAYKNIHICIQTLITSFLRVSYNENFHECSS